MDCSIDTITDIESSILQVMETKDMLYIVSEYASQGEIFGKKKKKKMLMPI